MALVCNIDQRGRQYRYRVGFVLVALGAAFLLVAPRFVNGRSPWVIGGLLGLGGLVSLFEANRGWCVARAMGFKTKI